MTTLMIVGAGGHGKVVADTALASGTWQRIVFIDDRAGALTDVLGLPVLGTLADVTRLGSANTQVIVAIGDAHRRVACLREYAEKGLNVATVIHPTAWVSRFAKIGAGSVVFAQAVIQPGSILGEGCIVNTAATVDHDCQLGDGVHVCPGAHLAGDVRVGAWSWIGIGSSVRNGVVIGASVTVGAGAAVVDDFPDEVTAVGVPARARNSR